MKHIQEFTFRRNDLVPKWILDDPSNEHLVRFNTDVKVHRNIKTNTVLVSARKITYKYLVRIDAIDPEKSKPMKLYGASGKTIWHGGWIKNMHQAVKVMKEAGL